MTDTMIASPAAPLPAATPSTTPAAASSPGFFSSLLSNVTGKVTAPATSFLANGGLIVVGVILGIAALVVSQRQTIVQVGKTAARAAAV
jgi:hypothetical protein